MPESKNLFTLSTNFGSDESSVVPYWGAASIDPLVGRTGPGALKFTGNGRSQFIEFNVRKGDVFTASFYVRKDSAFVATDAKMRISIADDASTGNGTHLTSVLYRNNDLIAPDAWIFKTVTYLIPFGVERVRFYFQSNGHTAGTVWVDDVNVTIDGIRPLEDLAGIDQACEDYRYDLDVMRRAKPTISFYRNKANPDADGGILGNIPVVGPLIDGLRGPAAGADPGLEYYGRVIYQDTIRSSFPFKKNQSSQAILELRYDHYISEWMRTIPNDPNQCKNVVIRVDFFGGKLRWSGLLHHWAVKVNAEGIRYMELTFHDDIQFLQFLLGPPNPVLPIPVFQFPRVLPIFGPAKWACSILILINLIRKEGNLWTLPDDPFDFDEWFDILPSEWEDWQCHIKCKPLPLDDSSLWTVFGTRMNPIDAVLAEPMDDAQLTLRYRRVFTEEGETMSGVLFVDPDGFANGALVFEIVDDSGFYDLLKGTFLQGSIADGFVRSVVQYVGGFVEDSVAIINDDETLYPDEYWGPGWLATLAQAPWLVIRDNSWTPVESRDLTWSPATAVGVVVGGDNPIANAIARLIIQTAGNVAGYFLLGGFSSAGDIAADLIMPFLEGTIAAWLEWKNIGRAGQLGWVHLYELYQQGAENNAWSLSALAALRGGFLATRSETSHTVNLRGTNWVIPGVHFQLGSRVGHTMRGFNDIIFVNQCESIDIQWDNTGEGPLTFTCAFGKNKAAMTSGERAMRLVKRFAEMVHNIGVHMVS